MSTEPYEPCIEACDACAAACERCASDCLGEHQIADLATCIRLNADCALLCRFTSTVLARESHLAPEIAALCARICDECAGESTRHRYGSCHTSRHACRICAEACRAVRTE